MSDHYTYNGYAAPGAQNPGQGQQAPYARQPYAQGQYGQQAYGQQSYSQQFPAAPPRPQAPGQVAAGTGLAAWFNVTQPAYLKGLLLGAGVALVVTNPTVQKALIGGAVRVWAAVQGGMEEIKEQIEDVKAELSREG